MDGMDNFRPLIVITGPTASGKTSVAIELSRYCKAEAISADSRQIYKYLDIGTATPTEDEVAQLKHHFINIINPDEYYSAGVFAEEATKKAIELYDNDILPIVVGGSGLYVKALCDGIFKEDNSNEKNDIRDILDQKLEKYGKDKLYDELGVVDPESAAKYSDMNPRRIIRALEYFYQTGNKFSSRHEENHKKNFNPIYFGIDYERKILYDRINRRTKMMWESGLIEETKNILNMGYSRSLNALNTVGYKETIDFVDGKISEAQAIELISRNTRRYAKRQLTWYRRYDDMTWLSGSPASIAKEIFKIISKRKDINCIL